MVKTLLKSTVVVHREFCEYIGATSLLRGNYVTVSSAETLVLEDKGTRYSVVPAHHSARGAAL